MKKNMDALGRRMKENYENRTRFFLPCRTNTLIRLDGKNFKTFTRGLDKPFDERLSSSMDHAATKLCELIQGSVFGYVQSDEISILLQDFKSINTEAWFDGNIQKTASISASMATAEFNYWFNGFVGVERLAYFDSRVFSIPELVEVENYFIWRQKDAVRNSISMVAQSLYSHEELKFKSQSDMQEMIFQQGQNWNDIDPGFKRGRMIIRDNDNKWYPSPAIDFLKDRELFTSFITTEKED